jgi:hypothetical protein
MVSGESETPRSNTMTRGYLSLRFNESNPSHHLYVNTGGRTDGNYWVAYTLHFGGRKRRVRRSLGTKCLADAIRLRDELFARIERDGEEVPDRRRTGPADGDREGEMQPVPSYATPV